MDRDLQDGQDYDGELKVHSKYADVTRKILAACFEVATEMGSGFLESVYANALDIAMQHKGLMARREHPLKAIFRGECVGNFYADFIVEDKVIVELKAVKALAPEHFAQTINYLNVSGIDVALLVNFGMPRLQYRRLYRNEGNLEMRNRDARDEHD